MEQRSLGSLSVSIIGLGCNNFGIRLDEARTSTVVSAALDAGINFFDTADVYGGTHSETFLGKALGARRKQILVATKFGLRVDERRAGGARPEYIKSAVEESLRRLGTDYIDLYQLHRPDLEVPIADTLGALDELVRAGKVREIGASNLSAEQLREARRAVEPGAARFVSLQNEYSLIQRAPEQGVLEEVARQRVGFLPYFPLASGILSGKYTRNRPAPAGTRLAQIETPLSTRFLTEHNLELAETLAGYAERRGHSLLELAFAWLRAHREVASVIAGATSPQQVQANVAAAAWSLSASELREIDELVPRAA